MSVILILFCLLSGAACLQITPQDSIVKVVKGQSAQLKWVITTAKGENYQNGDINLIDGGRSIAVAFFKSEFELGIHQPYSGRGWTATHNRNTKEVVLDMKNVNENDDGNYYLKMLYIAGSNYLTDNKHIRLKVLVKPFYPSGSYTSGTITYNEGEVVTIKCEPDGSPKPITIVWEKNNVRYKETDTNNPNLVFSNVTKSDMGKYVCKASNEAGSADTNPRTQLVVKYKPVNTKFNTSDGQALLDGKRVTLACTADADPKAVYDIFGGGVPPVTGSATGRVPVRISLTNHDGNTVSCIPKNSLGSGPRVDFLLDVKVPPKVLDPFPKTMNAIEGRNYSVTCFASGKPAAKIIWLRHGAPLRNLPVTYVTGRRPDNTFASEATLTLSPARREDNGIYGCQAENAYGDALKKVTLNLMYLPEVTNIKDFKEREVRVGDRVTLDCIAKGNPATRYYVWRWENGTVIKNETNGKLEFDSIEQDEGGRLSCAGGSYIGEGEKRYINLLVRVPPRIIVPPQLRVSLNESERLLLFCNASGVPEPTIYWERDGTLLRIMGEMLSIPYVKYSDRGRYTCTADNGIYPNASASSDVTIYFRPVIVTTSAAATLLGAESGQIVELVCVAEALPVAKFKWLFYPSMQELNTSVPDVLSIEASGEKTFTMKVKARFGAKYLCYAYNNRGNDTQIYEIRPKGPPEAPVLDSVETYIHNIENQLSTVRAHLKWTPGYNGGQSVWYKVYYRPRADAAQTISNIDDNSLTIKQGLEANTHYEFYVQAFNNDGPSNSSNIVSRSTKAFYGSASVERLDKGKIVKVSFVIYTEENVTKEVQYREKKENSFWETRNVHTSQEPLVINNLDPEKHYIFRVRWSVEGTVQITDGGEVGPWSPPPNTGGGSDSSGLTKEEIIAVIAGVGGFLLIVILVLFLCLIRRRQKPSRDETVVVMRRQPQAVDVALTRRSLIGSVEDDPFESAHYGTQERKKARDSYYLPDSEDMNTFTSDNTAKRANPVENSQAYQPYKFGQKAQYDDDGISSSDDGSYPYKNGGQKLGPSDDEMSSEPGYARVGDLNGKVPRDSTNGSRDPPRPDPNDVYARVNKGNNNNRPLSNGRGAPPPYRPRSTADTPLPPYPNDQLDLDDPAAVAYDDPLPPPMPVLPTTRSIPDGIWHDRYSDDPRDSVDTTLERQKSPSRTSLGGKPYINAQGKLVRPGSASRLSSSENFDDSEQRLPEPEVPSRRSRHLDSDNDESNLVSYLV